MSEIYFGRIRPSTRCQLWTSSLLVTSWSTESQWSLLMLSSLISGRRGGGPRLDADLVVGVLPQGQQQFRQAPTTSDSAPWPKALGLLT